MATAVTATESLDQKRLLKVLTAFSRGDFSVRMPADRTGLAGYHRHIRKPVVIAELISTVAELASAGQRAG